MKLKKIICLVLSLLMMSACFAALPAFAYVDISKEATAPNSVYATITKSNITAWSGSTSATVENGQYKLVSTGSQYPSFTVKAPQVDAGEYVNVVVEMSISAMSTKKGYVWCIYSDDSNAVKGVYPATHTDGEFVTVTATFEAKSGLTINSLKFQPFGEEGDLASAGNVCLIRSIKFVKDNTADKVCTAVGKSVTNGSGCTVENNVEFDGATCTKITKSEGDSNWMYVKFGWAKNNVPVSTYKYAVVEMYCQCDDSSTSLSIYPRYRVVEHTTADDSDATNVNRTAVNLFPGTAQYGYDLSADHRQAFVYNAWTTYVFPLESNYNGTGMGDGIILQDGLQFTDSGTNDVTIYLKSVTYTVEAPKSENITFTPETAGITLAQSTTFGKTVKNDKLVWTLGNGTSATDYMQLKGNNIAIPVATYNYVLVNCYYTGSAGAYPSMHIMGTKNSGITSWYALYQHDGGVSAQNIAKDTRLGRGDDAGKWLTLVFPIVNTDVVTTSNSFSTTEVITSFMFAPHGNGGNGDDVYVSSITFSATPVAVEDKSVSEAENIMFRGVQNASSLDADGNNSIRMIATLKDIDLTAYSKVGFEVAANEITNSYEATTVFNSILENTESGIAEVKATDYSNGKYIVALELGEMPADVSTEFTVKSYLVDNNGNKVYGITAKVTVVNGIATACTWEVA